MERGLFRMLRAELRRIGRRRTDRRQTHTDATIVEVYFWAVLHDRPVSWACRIENWSGTSRRATLPSSRCRIGIAKAAHGECAASHRYR